MCKGSVAAVCLLWPKTMMEAARAAVKNKGEPRAETLQGKVLLTLEAHARSLTSVPGGDSQAGSGTEHSQYAIKVLVQDGVDHPASKRPMRIYHSDPGDRGHTEDILVAVPWL